MEIFQRAADLPAKLRGGILSIGKFDGLHLGHAKVASAAVAAARERRVPAILFTFSPPPVAILKPELATAPLVDPQTKRALVANAGFDAMIEFPTTREFLNLTAEDFFADIVVGQIGAVGLVEGSNFSFGRNREGSGERLRELAESFGLALEIVAPAQAAGAVASSSAIRRALGDGNVLGAAALLGRRYGVSGRIGHGDARGRTLEYTDERGVTTVCRTANLSEIEVFLPQDAVYAAIAKLPSGRRYAAGVNLGPNPSFNDAKWKFEAHILDFDGDLYDSRLDIEFCEKLRDVKKFASKEDLMTQIALDLKNTRRIAEAAMSES